MKPELENRLNLIIEGVEAAEHKLDLASKLVEIEDLEKRMSLPEIWHDEVKLGGNLDLFYPHWSHGITLSRAANQVEIIDTVDAAMHKYNNLST